MPAPPPGPAAPLTDAEVERLDALLAALPAPLEPLDASALDGYLCGVVLQPHPVPAAAWEPGVADVDGRPAPAGPATDELFALVRRRHAELAQAIAQRQWFDPWIFPLDEEDAPTASVLPWVAGFAAAMERFPALMAIDDPELIEPLALLYLHFDPADLEDADALAAVIETLEPPADLAEAVESLVNSVLLLADVTRPLASTRPRRAAPPRPRRPGPGGGGKPKPGPRSGGGGTRH